MQRVPLGVSVPTDVNDVCALVRWAAAERLPIVPRGSGSSMAGGAVGVGLIVDLSRLNELLPVDSVRRTVSGGAGVPRRLVEHAANAVGLRFPVDPSSGAFATIGGMTATNAAGPRTMALGPMRRWVSSIDCVFADGSRATVSRGAAPPRGVAALDRWLKIASGVRRAAAALPPRRVRKESSGYGVHDFAQTGELVDLLVGSEGTLALFTKIELHLTEMPAATASILAAWGSLEQGVAGAALAREAGASACELLDRTFLEVARSGGAVQLPLDTECLLLIELEGDASTGRRAESLARSFDSVGATSVMLGLDAESEEALWALRHAASPILARLDPNLKSMQLVEDSCVPPDRLSDYVRGVRNALEASGLRGVIFGHAGDAHVHVNALVDVRDADWDARVRRLFARVVSLTSELGGTLAGEHGDGRLRTPSLPRTWSREACALFAQIKGAFDPDGVLNPGVIVPVGADDPLTGNKYDPALHPLPIEARTVLTRVERERAYDVSRLEMLDGHA